MKMFVRMFCFSLPLWCFGCATVQPNHIQGGYDQERQILITLVEDNINQPQALIGNPNSYYRKQRQRYQISNEINRKVDYLAQNYGLQRIKGWPIVPIGVYCEVLQVPEQMEINGVIKRLAADPRVETAQKVNTFNVLSAKNNYDDPYLELQHGLTHMNVLQAHQLSSGQGVTIAIIDSAIDKEHLELKNSIIQTQNFATEHAISRAEKHGTAVAGVIASSAGNMAGIVGVAPDAKILGLRACWLNVEQSSSTCDSFRLAQALSSAIEQKADIINMSLGGPKDALLERLIQHAISQGTIVVAAAGRLSNRSQSFPASMSEVIAAQSLSFKDEREVIFAPGSDVLTTMPRGAYDFVTGSSFAAAHISGVIALILQHNPELQQQAMKKILSISSYDQSVDACNILAQVTGKSICQAGPA